MDGAMTGIAAAQPQNPEHTRQTLARWIQAHAGGDGVWPTGWPALKVFRSSTATPRAPVVYEPCVCVVAQGRKRAFLDASEYVYDPLHYLVLSVPLPIESQITEASKSHPFLSLKITIDTNELSRLLLELGDGDADFGLPRGIAATRLTQPLADTVIRLLRSVDDPTERRVLAPLIQRELLYRLLTDEQGDLLRAVASRDSRSNRVARALHFLQLNYDQPIDIQTVAEVACMSTSALHQSFKQVTSLSPIQYLKRIRLHEARRLLIHDGSSATEAAHRVGYNSASQFSREFKAFFGVQPSRAKGASGVDTASLVPT